MMSFGGGVAAASPFWVAVLLLVLSPVGLSAQQPATLNGVVEDPTDAAVVGARVTLIGEAGAQRAVVTDATGSYAFPPVPPGRYTVIVSAPGFAESRLEIRLVAGETSSLPVTLAVADVTEQVSVLGIVESTHSVAATKDSTPLIEVPQAVSVVNREQMDARNVQSVAQALRYASGVTAEQRGVNTGSLEYVYGRGFQIGTFMDGLRMPDAGAGFNIVSVDAHMLERVDLIHGPASVLYGESSPGGLLNLTSKRPAAVARREVEVQSGSYGLAQVAFDATGPIADDPRFLYRVVAGGLRSASQVNDVDRQRVYLAPSFTWKPGERTQLTVLTMYQRDPEAGYYNLTPAAGMVLPNTVTIPRSLNPGDPTFDEFTKRAYSMGYALEHRLSSAVTVHQNLRYLDSDEYIQGVFADDGLSADGLSLGRYSFFNDSAFDNFTVDNRLHATLRHGALHHNLTFGVDYQASDYHHVFMGNFNTPSLDILSPTYGGIPEPDFLFASSGDDTASQIGFYAQDHVQVGALSVLAGIRRDDARSESVNLKFGDVSTQDDSAWTGRVGATYLLPSGIAPYVGYATSFEPVLNSDFFGNPFVPTTGQQIEGGVKIQPTGSQAFATIAVFDVTQQNVSTADPEHAFFSIQTGEVRARGVELEAQAPAGPNVDLLGSYTYVGIENTLATVNLGKSPTGIAEHSGSLWGEYRLPAGPLRGLALRGGVRYVGPSWGDAANTFQVPAYTLIDLGFNFSPRGRAFLADGWQLGVFATNLLDKTYVSQCLGLNDCSYGLGRVVNASLKYRW